MKRMLGRTKEAGSIHRREGPVMSCCDDAEGDDDGDDDGGVQCG
jgi:hypothetical protein